MTIKAPFEAIVETHGATVWRVCRAVVDEHEVDDAWSETFLAALRAYPELPNDANVEAWLVTIAHRKAIDLVRSRARRAITVDAMPERPSPLGNPGSNDDVRELVGALRALAPKQRQAVAYHYLGGLPYADVAELIGGSADAARRAASDGIAALRRTIAPHQEGAMR